MRDVAADPGLVEGLVVPGHQATLNRAVLIHVAGFDWNCQQHITPRWSEEEVAEEMEPMRKRITHLEAEHARLRRQLGLTGRPFGIT